ncbi:MAG TPA: M14 family zinc carboxypeptidase, partial [Bacteroidia bacterium]|nr:M14 family zinc carboxypeptidase [Bacteroidia bacterium]
TNAEIKYLVDNLEMYFIPCVNPDGYIYNHTTNPTGGGMWRKNRRNNGDGTYGVDLNRNYGYNWGYDNVGSSPTTSADNYRGTAAFSEPETQMMRNFCNAHTFQLAISNHTYANVLVQPYGYAGTAYTPDSLLFTDFGMRLTYCDGFTYGSALQTVGYVANGISDDWMYGEQSSKPKIYSMTPEAGSVDDGFYPLQANITPIAKNTLDQNIYAARLAATYAEVKDQSGPFIQQNGYIVYSIERLGLQPGTFSVSITPLGGNFQTTGSGNSHASMTELQTITDSVSFTLVSGLTPGTVVRFLLNVNNGSYTLSDTITRVYGVPVTIFSDNCSSTAQWTGTWGTSSAHYVSPPTSITDSPLGNYASNSNTKTSTTNTISLGSAVAAYLEYYARWEIEKNYDYAEVQISTNNGTSYTPLCARYTHDGNSNQDNGKPLYDGFQRVWVKERIDLSAYLGQNIKLRFNMVADGAVDYDGFYFDDITVKIINTAGAGIASVQNNEGLQVYPDPNNGLFVVSFNGPLPEFSVLTVTNVLGETVLQKNNVKPQQEIDLQSFSEGTYFIKIQAPDKVYTSKIIITKK